MKKFLCEKLKFCISNSSIALAIVILTLSLQTFMIARSLVLMYDINEINSSIQADYYSLKKIRAITDKTYQMAGDIILNKTSAKKILAKISIF